MKTFEWIAKTFVRIISILLLFPIVPGVIIAYLMLWAWDHPTYLFDDSNAVWYGIGIMVTLVYLISIPFWV